MRYHCLFRVSSTTMGDTFTAAVSESVEQRSQSAKCEFFEIAECANHIRSLAVDKRRKIRVALQFPDDLLVDAVFVSSQLQNLTNSEVFVLADTSYGCCCADEVAASHGNADLLIHFGPACLSQTRYLPVFYVFGRKPLGVLSFVNNICEFNSQKLLVLYDLRYHHAVGQMEQLVRERVKNGASKFSSCVFAHVFNQIQPAAQSVRNNNSGNLYSVCGYNFVLSAEEVLSDYTAVWIGQESEYLTNIVLNLHNVEMWIYNPDEESSITPTTLRSNKMLQRRYYLIEKVKQSSIIGIIVGTLSIANVLDILQRLKKIIKDAGKKYYVFSVGKINVPKLANFSDVDIFVFVSCPYSTIIDCRDYFSEVVSPFDVEIALVDRRDGQESMSQIFGSCFLGLVDMQLHYQKARIATRVRCCHQILLSEKICLSLILLYRDLNC
eukprot:746306_1